MTNDTDTDQQDSPGRNLRPLKHGSPSTRFYAYLYLTLLFVIAPAAAIVAGLHFGYIDPYVKPTVTPNLSGPVTIFVYGVTGLFLYWTFVQVVRVTGVGFIRGTLTTLDRLNLDPLEDDEE